jgi:hypothetical protein
MTELIQFRYQPLMYIHKSVVIFKINPGASTLSRPPLLYYQYMRGVHDYFLSLSSLSSLAFSQE